MSQTVPRTPLVAIVGGHTRRWLSLVRQLPVRHFPSRKSGGNGGLRCALMSIRHGSLRQVLVLTRWIGHAESDAIRGACATQGIPCRLVGGGVEAVRREIEAFLNRATE